MRALTCRIAAVDKLNVATLDEPAVASVYAGFVPAEQNPQTHQLVPPQATWRVRLDSCEGAPSLAREIVAAGRGLLGKHCFIGLRSRPGNSRRRCRRGNYFDNAQIESFWDTLKSEFIHHRRFATREQMRQAISELLFYNRQHTQARLD
jgi:hypothetical protein